MKAPVLIFLVILLTGIALAEAVDVVKSTKNAQGQLCGQIPQFLKDKLGYRELVADWISDRVDGFYQVTLNVTAQKDLQVDGVYMSYRWQPQWVWAVRTRDNNVRPANKLAENWMAGKL
jgi:hypothetical protein